MSTIYPQKPILNMEFLQHAWFKDKKIKENVSATFTQNVEMCASNLNSFPSAATFIFLILLFFMWVF